MIKALCFLIGLGLVVAAVDDWFDHRARTRARAALLRALMSGPGDALALRDRVQEQTDGELWLGDRVYSALRDLVREGLVERCEIDPLPDGRLRYRYKLRSAPGAAPRPDTPPGGAP